MNSIKAGALAAYREKCASVIAVNADKLEIGLADGSRKSVRFKDIVPLHPGPVKNLPPGAVAAPDWEEVRALVEGEERLPFADWVELAYGEFSVESAWAGYGELLEAVYWCGSPEEGVVPRPAEAVAATLAAREEKQRKRDLRGALLERIRSGQLTEADRPALVEIELVARGERDNSALMRDLNWEATSENAHRLLLRLGVWSDLDNPWPSRAGIDLQAPELPLPEALPEEERRDLSAEPAWAIDNSGSEDPDDAIGWSADGALWVHVADAAALIVPEGEADLEARRRGANLYLPEGVIPMLPEAATVRLGLGLSELSPALSLKIRFDPEGDARLEEFTLSRVRVTRTTYEAAEELMDGADWRPMLEELARFDAFRAAQGAVELTFPEVEVKVRDGEIVLLPVEETRSRRLVRSAMLAAGRAVARWAEENAVAMPFVSQSFSEDAPVFEGAADTWVESFRRRQFFQSAQESALAGRHAGLGLPAYVRVTSPLRRYADLLAHRQLRAVLRGQEALDSEGIDRILTYSSAGALARRQAERRSDDFWKMVWFSRHPEWRGTAQLLGTIRDKAVYLVPELGYEFRSRFGADGVPGSEFPVRVGEVDLAGEYCQLLLK